MKKIDSTTMVDTGFCPECGNTLPCIIHQKAEVQSQPSYFLQYDENLKKTEGEVESETTWIKVENKFGEVEASVYKKKGTKSDKAIIYIPGIGGATNKFKTRHIGGLIDSGYDVIVLHRNGAVLNNNPGAAESQERLNLATQNGEDHIGKKEEYGYDEWTKELAAAFENFNADYNNVRIVGQSFGGLITLESLRALQEANHPGLGKIKSFVSLSGKIGLPFEDSDDIEWVDKNRGLSTYTSNSAQEQNSFEKVFDKNIKGGLFRTRKPEVLLPEYKRIINTVYDSKLPEITYVHAMPFDEHNFSPYQGRNLRTKIKNEGGKFVFINDFSQVEQRTDRHGFPTLTPETLKYWLEYEPKRNDEIMAQSGPNAQLEPANLDTNIRYAKRNTKKQ